MEVMDQRWGEELSWRNKASTRCFISAGRGQSGTCDNLLHRSYHCCWIPLLKTLAHDLIQWRPRKAARIKIQHAVFFFLFFPRVDLERDVIGVVEGSSSDFVPEEVIVSRHC